MDLTRHVNQPVVLHIGEPAADVAGALAAVGFALVTAAADDAVAVGQRHAPSVVVVAANGLTATTIRKLTARAHAQRFMQPCIVIDGPRGHDADYDADLSLPATVTARELAARVRAIVGSLPRQVLREHRRVLATMPRPAWLIDAAGRIAAINTPAEILFGVHAGEIVAQPWELLIGAARAEPHRWLFTTRRTGDRTEVGVIQLAVQGRADRKIECSASGLWAGAPDAGGTFVGTFVLGVDVTAAHVIDTQLLQATKLEAMGHLAGGIAHDFNNLLSVIIGSAQLFRHDHPDHPAIDDLREIETAGARAAQMTKQLLMFSRKQEPETIVFDVGQRIHTTSRMLQRLLGERVRLQVKLGARPMGIRADPGQLEQVLVNLAVNARDAMPDGGRLLISADLVEHLEPQPTVPGMAPGRWVQIEVADEGEGMTPEIREKIFEPFFTTKPKERGTGLGLSVVYGIVKRHDGHIDVRSTPGRGTRFRIWFSEVADLAAKPVPPRSVMHAGGERILLVEDDDMVRRYLTRTLESHGYSVLPVADGPTALAVAASLPSIDLLVADVGLPGMLGTELAVHLRQRFAELRVIYISGHIDLVADLGAADLFVAKPVNASRLLGVVREALDRIDPRG